MRALKATGATTAETSFYPPIATLFNHVGSKLKPHVVFSTQVSSTASAKQPDGGFFPVIKNSKATGPIIGQRPDRGVVEIKPAGLLLPALEHFRIYCRLFMQSLNHAFAFSGVMSLMASAIACSSISLVLAWAERSNCLSLAQAFSIGLRSGEYGGR
jgi:hypothetical protein